jgi:transcriptional regulator with XRE-family HTH domain
MTTENTDGDSSFTGERLRQAREYLGFSQEQVAKYMGCSQLAISDVESGNGKFTEPALKKLSRLYCRPVSHFTGEDPTDPLVDESVEGLDCDELNMSYQDWVEIVRFARFLRDRKRFG